MLDVVIVGGGPAGLAAALVLARSRKRVVVIDGGTPRNATAAYIGGFITQDRITPAQFRSVALEDLRAYPSVEIRKHTLVEAVARAGGHFIVRAGGTDITARRVILCTGVIDEPLPLAGSRALWGSTLFQCPYCHAWEHRDRAYAFLAPDPGEAAWVQLLRSWTRDVMLLTNGAFELDPATRHDLDRAGIPIEERRITGLLHEGPRLTGLALEGGAAIARDILFFRPQQKQVPVVAALGVAHDERGFVRVDAEFRTSIPGIYAAGDLATHHHGALAAAAAGSQAAHCLNLELTLELVAQGVL